MSRFPPSHGKEMYTLKHSVELDVKKRGPGNWIVRINAPNPHFVLYMDNHKTSKHYGETTIALDHSGIVTLNAKIMMWLTTYRSLLLTQRAGSQDDTGEFFLDDKG